MSTSEHHAIGSANPFLNASDHAATTNACKLCTPLGACIVFKGVAGAVPFLHGSQGCATYMRRYLISHFREPVDIASSSLGEKEAVYGGGANLKAGVVNVAKKYAPAVIGIATTCLTETIGDDVPGILCELAREWPLSSPLPALVRVSTPSYQGSHMEGFHRSVKALVEQLSEKAGTGVDVNLLPGLVTPEDLRHLKEILADFGLTSTILPDYSETLDGPALCDYQPVPDGGTTVDEIRGMGSARHTLELGRSLSGKGWAGGHLLEKFGLPLKSLGLPVGLRESDEFFNALEEVSGRETPGKYALQRGRLVDSYVDGHKYVFGKKAVVYGEEDLVIGLAHFLAEIGIIPVVCATGQKSPSFAASIKEAVGGLVSHPVKAVDEVDFHEIGGLAAEAGPDFLIGNSKGYQLSKELGVPLLRVGFPIHDRFGGQRLLNLGYQGTQRLYDEIVNMLLAVKQESSSVGYGYL